VQNKLIFLIIIPFRFALLEVVGQKIRPTTAECVFCGGGEMLLTEYVLHQSPVENTGINIDTSEKTGAKYI